MSVSRDSKRRDSGLRPANRQAQRLSYRNLFAVTFGSTAPAFDHKPFFEHQLLEETVRNPREFEGDLYCMIWAMARDRLDYDPKSPYQSTASAIESATELAGCPVRDDTVRKALNAAEQFFLTRSEPMIPSALTITDRSLFRIVLGVATKHYNFEPGSNDTRVAEEIRKATDQHRCPVERAMVNEILRRAAAHGQQS